MKLDEFVNKYLGKFVEAGGSANAKFQCVDLINQYLVEVLGYPKILWINAKDFSKKAGELYNWIDNTPYGIPKKGDIMVWDSGTWGHVAIYISGDVNRFKSFDQNYGTNKACRVVSHGYKSISGWLSPKVSQTASNDNLKACLKAHSNAMKGLQQSETREKKLQKKLEHNKKVKQELANSIQELLKQEKEYKKVVQKLEKDNKEINAMIKKKTGEASFYQQQVETVNEELKKIKQELTSLKKQNKKWKAQAERGLDGYRNAELIGKVLERIFKI